MGNLSSTCLLIQDRDGAASLRRVEARFDPGKKVLLDSDRNILLAGGFSSLFPQTDFPLSSAFQLNCDRGVFSQDYLTRIALAEFERINGIQFNSYTVDLDARVCVIGEDPAALDTFLDIYGGILEVEPLLLKGQDPEIPTATELNVEMFQESLRLEYRVRLPIRTDLCTYCGDCGSVCPEMSISPYLFLDFTTCTLCKECEKICQAGAIDVARVESRTMEIPALILLEGVADELVEGNSLVYYEKNLKDYFSTLFSCQVDEVVVCDKSICQYSSGLGIGCNLCLGSCKFGAVSQGRDGVLIDPVKCEECGNCVAACPTGALQNRRFDDRSFVEFFTSIDLSAGTTVVIGDEGALHRVWWQTQQHHFDNVFFLEYSPLQSLSLFHLMFLLSRGAARIVLLGDENRETELFRQVTLANSLITSLFNTTERIIITGVDELVPLLSVGTEAEGLSESRGAEPFVNRRRELSLSLQSLVGSSGKVADVQPQEFISFGTLSCDRDRCTQCLACLHDCRIQALGADEGQLTLNLVGSMCVACGICVHVCPEDALQLSPHFRLDRQFFKPVEMARAEPMVCRSCGKVFGTRKSFERVMEILSQKEPVDTRHFEYCDTCRVIKLFESE